MQTVTLLKKQTGPETHTVLIPGSISTSVISHQFQNAFFSGNSEISVTSILLFPGSKAAFQAVDVVDSTGESTVKLLRGITVEGAFQESHKHDITMLWSRISQPYLDSLQDR